MLKVHRVASELFVSVLEGYVDGLDAKAANISLLKGKCELTNLKLKTTVLNDFGLPCRLHWGVLGRLSVSLSWKSLLSAPLVVQLDGLHLLATPISGHRQHDGVLDDDDVRRYAVAIKQRLIQRLSSPRKGAGDGDTMQSRLAAHIVDNISVVCGPVHLRFEMFPAADKLIAMDLHIRAITVRTDKDTDTDTDGQGGGGGGGASAPSQARNLRKKAVSVEGVACYCAAEALLGASITRVADQATREGAAGNARVLGAFRAAQESFGAAAIVFGRHDFTASVLHQGAQESAEALGQSFVVAVEGKQAKASVCQQQYSNLWQVMACFRRIQVQMEGMHKRPHAPVASSPLLWWRYAAGMGLARRPVRKSYWHWGRIKQHCARRREYIELCKQAQREVPGPALLAQLAAVEVHLSAHRIVLYRQLARCDTLWLQSSRKGKLRQRLQRIMTRRRSSQAAADSSGGAGPGLGPPVASSLSFDQEYAELQRGLAQMLEQEAVDAHEVAHAELHVSAKIGRVQLELKDAEDKRVLCEVGIRGVTFASSTGFNLATAQRFQSTVESVDVLLPGNDGTLRHAVINTATQGGGADRTRIFADFCSADCLTSRSLMAVVVEYGAGRSGAPRAASTPPLAASTPTSSPPSSPITVMADATDPPVVVSATAATVVTAAAAPTAKVAAYMLPVEVKLTRTGIKAVHDFLVSPARQQGGGSDGVFLPRGPGAAADREGVHAPPRPSADFRISVEAPTIVVPAKDDVDPRTPCLIMNFGSHVVHGRYRPDAGAGPPGTAGGDGIQPGEAGAAGVFGGHTGSALSVESSGVQALITSRSDDWREFQRRSRSDAHLLCSTQSCVTIKDNGPEHSSDIVCHTPGCHIVLSASHIENLARFTQPLLRGDHGHRRPPRRIPSIPPGTGLRRMRHTFALTCSEVCVAFQHVPRDDEALFSQAIEVCAVDVVCKGSSSPDAETPPTVTAKGFYCALRPDVEAEKVAVLVHSSMAGPGAGAPPLQRVGAVAQKLRENNTGESLRVTRSRAGTSAFSQVRVVVANIDVVADNSTARHAIPLLRHCVSAGQRAVLQLVATDALPPTGLVPDAPDDECDVYGLPGLVAKSLARCHLAQETHVAFEVRRVACHFVDTADNLCFTMDGFTVGVDASSSSRTKLSVVAEKLKFLKGDAIARHRNLMTLQHAIIDLRSTLIGGTQTLEPSVNVSDAEFTVLQGVVQAMADLQRLYSGMCGSEHELSPPARVAEASDAPSSRAERGGSTGSRGATAVPPSSGQAEPSTEASMYMSCVDMQESMHPTNPTPTRPTLLSKTQLVICNVRAFYPESSHSHNGVLFKAPLIQCATELTWKPGSDTSYNASAQVDGLDVALCWASRITSLVSVAHISISQCARTCKELLTSYNFTPQKRKLITNTELNTFGATPQAADECLLQDIELSVDEVHVNLQPKLVHRTRRTVEGNMGEARSRKDRADAPAPRAEDPPPRSPARRPSLPSMPALHPDVLRQLLAPGRQRTASLSLGADAADAHLPGRAKAGMPREHATTEPIELGSSKYTILRNLTRRPKDIVFVQLSVLRSTIILRLDDTQGGRPGHAAGDGGGFCVFQLSNISIHGIHNLYAIRQVSLDMKLGSIVCQQSQANSTLNKIKVVECQPAPSSATDGAIAHTFTYCGSSEEHRKSIEFYPVLQIQLQLKCDMLRFVARPGVRLSQDMVDEHFREYTPVETSLQASVVLVRFTSIEVAQQLLCGLVPINDGIRKLFAFAAWGAAEQLSMDTQVKSMTLTIDPTLAVGAVKFLGQVTKQDAPNKRANHVSRPEASQPQRNTPQRAMEARVPWKKAKIGGRLETLQVAFLFRGGGRQASVPARKVCITSTCEAHIIKNSRTDFMSIECTDLSAVSVCTATDATEAQPPKLQILSRCSLYGTHRATGDESLSVTVSSEAVAARISYNEIEFVKRFQETVVSLLAKAPDTVYWDQRCVPVVKRQAAKARAPLKQALEEKLSVQVENINVTFVDVALKRQRPVVLISSSLDVDARNWTSQVTVAVHSELAVAILERDRSIWEPLLLAPPNEKDQVQPITMYANVHTAPAVWIDYAGLTIISQSDHLKSVSSVARLIDQKTTTFWDAGVSKGDNFVVFELHRVTTLTRMRYGVCTSGDHAPNANRLEVGETPQGPWTAVVSFSGSRAVGVCYSPSFSATGKFWRWTIASRYGSCAAHIQAVDFEQLAGGTMMEVILGQVAEMSLSTKSMHAMQELVASWVGSSAPKTARNQGPVQQAAGTHEVINSTGHALAVSSTATFDPKKAMLIPSQSRSPIDFGGIVFAGYKEHIVIDKSVPVTHIDIIDTFKGQRAPRGWHVLQKKLNQDNGPNSLFLIFKRDSEARPITDLWLKLGKGDKTPFDEPTPEGFECIKLDIYNGKGVRPGWLCYRHGHGAPLTDIVVVDQTRNEGVPATYSAMPRSLSAGLGPLPSRHLLIATKRQPILPEAERMRASSDARARARHSTQDRAGSESNRPHLAQPPRVDASAPPDFVAIVSKTSGGAVGAITELAIVSHPDIKQNPNLLLGYDVDFTTPWCSKYREGSLLDLNQGKGNNTYLLHRRNHSVLPITAIRIVRDEAIAEEVQKADHTTAHMQPPKEKKDAGCKWIRLQTPLNVGGDGFANAPAYIEYMREPGASPIVSIDFIFADSEPVPTGHIVADASVTTPSSLFSKYLDLKLVLCYGDYVQNLPLLFTPEARRRSRAQMHTLDTGVASVGMSRSVQKTVMVQSTVSIPWSSKPVFSVKPHGIAAATGSTQWSFSCEPVSEMVFSIIVTRTDQATGWSTDLSIDWSISIRKDRGSKTAFVSPEATLAEPEAAPKIFQAVNVLGRHGSKIPRISFEIEGWKPLSNIDVDYNTTRVFVLEPIWKPGQARVAVSVRLDDHVKVIELSSPIVIRNGFDFPLQVCYQQTLNDDDLLGSVDPGGVFPIPLGLADNYHYGEIMIPLHMFWNPISRAQWFTTNPLDVKDLSSTLWAHQTAVGYVYRTRVSQTIKLWGRGLQPTDARDEDLPALTTNVGRAAKDSCPEWRELTEADLIAKGYRVLGYIYQDPQPRAVGLSVYWHSPLKQLMFSTEPISAGQDLPHSTFVGFEGYFPVHHGLVRVRPVVCPPGHPQEAFPDNINKVWDWSKERLQTICQIDRNRRQMSSCTKGMRRPHYFQCEITQLEETSPEWILEAPICIRNTLPCTIYIAVSISPEAPGSHCTAIKPGMEESASVFSGSNRMISQDSETAPPLYLWVSLVATEFTLLASGIAVVDAYMPSQDGHRTDAAIQAVVIQLDEPLPDTLGLDGVSIHTRLQENEAQFQVNTKLISNQSFALQVVRVDEATGWETSLNVAWEIVVKDDLNSRQVALEHWCLTPFQINDPKNRHSKDVSETVRVSWTAGDQVQDLFLGVHQTHKYGTFGPVVTNVFCPYLISNKTGMDLAYSVGEAANSLWYSRELKKSKERGLFAPPTKEHNSMVLSLDCRQNGTTDSVGCIPFHTNTSSQLYKSKPVLLDEVSGMQLVSLYNVQDSMDEVDETHQRVTDVCVYWAWGSDERLWRDIQIFPACSFVNNTEHSFQLGIFPVAENLFRKHRVDHEETQLLHAKALAQGTMLPSNMLLTDKCCRISLPTTAWSSPLPLLDQLTSANVKMLGADGKLQMLFVEITTRSLHRVVTFKAVSAVPPMRVENHCSKARLVFYQQLSPRSTCLPRRYVLESGTQMNYEFDDCTAPLKLCFMVDEAAMVYDAQNVDAMPGAESGSIAVGLYGNSPFTLEYRPIDSNVIHSARGFVLHQHGTRVFVIADTIADCRLALGLTAAIANERLIMELTVVAPGLGLSLVDSNPHMTQMIDGLVVPRELLYIVLGGIVLNYTQTSEYIKRYVTVTTAQIDHQTWDAFYDVILRPKDEVPTLPILQAARVTRLAQYGRGQAYNVEQYNVVAVQPLLVKVDDALLATVETITAFVQSLRSSMALVAGRHVLAGPTVTLVDTVYFLDRVELHPVEVFVTTSLRESQSLKRYFGSMGIAMRTLMVAIGNVNELPIKFSGLQLEDAIMTMTRLWSHVYYHLASQALQTMTMHGLLAKANVVASIELMGGAGTAVRKVGDGVVELIVEPARAVIQQPEAFGTKIGQGSKNLAKGLIGGMSGIGASITGTLGTGLAALSFDDKFQNDRKRAIQLQSTDTSGDRLASGVMQFGKSVVSGVTGLWEQPIKGGQQNGFLGGVEGVGKGLAGLVFKPVGGAIDMVQTSFAGIESMTNTQAMLKRRRDPRYISPTGVVTPYSWHKVRAVCPCLCRCVHTWLCPAVASCKHRSWGLAGPVLRVCIWRGLTTAAPSSPALRAAGNGYALHGRGVRRQVLRPHLRVAPFGGNPQRPSADHLRPLPQHPGAHGQEQDGVQEL